MGGHEGVTVRYAALLSAAEALERVRGRLGELVGQLTAAVAGAGAATGHPAAEAAFQHYWTTNRNALDRLAGTLEGDAARLRITCGSYQGADDLSAARLQGLLRGIR